MKPTSVFFFAITTYHFLCPGISLAESSSISKFSFRAKPLPETRYFTILKAGVASRLAGNDSAKTISKNIYNLELGIMNNTSRSAAIGLGLSTFSCEETHFAANLRYRRWINPNLALDIVPRFYVLSTDTAFNFPGIGIAASLSVSELLSLDLAFDKLDFEKYAIWPYLNYGPRYRREAYSYTHFSLGISGRSYAASALGAGALIFLIIDGFAAD